MKKIPIVILLLVKLSTAGELKQVITPLVQPDQLVCWAACADMLLTYYDNYPNLHYIWVRGNGGIDATNQLCEPPPYFQNVHDILASGNPVRNVPSTCPPGTILWEDLPGIISDRKPVIAGLSGTNNGHVVLIIGYDTDGSVIFNDPSTGTERKLPYDYFCENDFWLWEESLLPDEGSPTGAVPIEGANISIATGPTTFVYPGANSTYTSTFYCPDVCMPPYEWNWLIKFDHKGGAHTALEGNATGWGSSTWNIPAFTLPSTGYHWIYDADGLIHGKVGVFADGYSDWELVTYAPQNLFPGYLVFQNKTYSSQHPEIYAHYCITFNNVNINSGASVTFNAGSCYDINAINVYEGANVTIRIDPSLE